MNPLTCMIIEMYVILRIDLIRMELGESTKVFLNQFLHLCYEFPEEMVDSDFIMEKFHNLILLSLRSFESELLDNSLSPTYPNHGIPQYSMEEAIIPFVPCLPPFPVPIWVPLGDGVKVGKFENQIVDLPIQPSSTSYDPHPIEENLEWLSNFMDAKVKVNPLGFQDHINAHKSNLESDPNENLIVSGDN